MDQRQFGRHPADGELMKAATRSDGTVRRAGQGRYARALSHFSP
jgi:hypothetical protein